MTEYLTLKSTNVPAAKAALTTYGDVAGLKVSSFQITNADVTAKYEPILLVDDYNG